MPEKRFYLRPDPSRPRIRDNIAAFLDSLPQDKVAEIRIKCPHRERRSNQANRYLWGCVYKAFTDILEGWDSEDVHEYLLGEYFGWERIEGMGKVRMKPIRRSSGLDKSEFAGYVDFAIRRGAQHGIVVPPPDTEIPEWVK